METSFFLRRLVTPVCAVAFLIMNVAVGNAQDVSAAHLDAARKAITAIGATDQFDDFLPSAARSMKMELVSKNPNLESLINTVVDEEALALAKRRGALEAEAARAYAKYFTEAELNQISTFYQSETGKKLLEKGPLAMGDTVAAFNEWRQSIARDLSTNVSKRLVEATSAKAGAAKPGAAKPGAKK